MCSDQGAPIKTKAVRASLLPEADVEEAFAEASRFRDELHACLTVRGDELFELADAVLCAPGAVRLMLAVDVSHWLRRDAPTSTDRLFCHVYGRAKSASQLIPGGPCRRAGRRVGQ